MFDFCGEEFLSGYSSFGVTFIHRAWEEPRTLSAPGKEVLLISGTGNQNEAFLEIRMLREGTVIERKSKEKQGPAGHSKLPV